MSVNSNKRTRWTEEETNALLDLVSDYLEDNDKVDWSFISDSLFQMGYNRSEGACRKKNRSVIDGVRDKLSKTVNSDVDVPDVDVPDVDVPDVDVPDVDVPSCPMNADCGLIDSFVSFVKARKKCLLKLFVGGTIYALLMYWVMK